MRSLLLIILIMGAVVLGGTALAEDDDCSWVFTIMGYAINPENISEITKYETYRSGEITGIDDPYPGEFPFRIAIETVHGYKFIYHVNEWGGERDAEYWKLVYRLDGCKDQ